MTAITEQEAATISDLPPVTAGALVHWARSILAATVSQMLPSDDKLICENVRQALLLLRTINVPMSDIEMVNRRMGS